MATDYVVGNQQGRADGQLGENRLAIRSAARLLQVKSYLPGAENRDAQFRVGYLAGFEDAVRVRRIVPHGEAGAPRSLQGADVVPANTSYAHQRELLLNLRQYLGDFQERLLGVSANYQRKVEQLHGEGGLMDETHRKLVEEHLEPTRALIARLVDHIGSSDIPAVERELAFVEQKL